VARKAGDWIDSYLKFTKDSEPPELYKMWVGISVLASALQRKVHLQWEKKVYPNMYIVLVGPSGKCRKGTAMYPGESLLRKLGIPLSAEAITREALIRELENSMNVSGADIGQAQHLVHSSLTVFSKELTVFLGYNNVNLMADMTDWYDCADNWTYRTKNAGTNEIVNVFMNMIGATTPDLIQSTLPNDAIGGGLSSRIIFVYENRKSKSNPAPFLTKADTDLFERLFLDLEEISLLKGEYEITSEFLDVWTEWYLGQEDNPPFRDERFAGYFQRRPHHALKLSLILTASKGDEQMITSDTLKRAIQILEQTEKKMPLTFRGMGSSDYSVITDKVMKTIANARDTGILFSRLLGLHYYDADKFILEKIVDTLSTMKYCVKVYEGNDMLIKYIHKDNRKEDKEKTNETE